MHAPASLCTYEPQFASDVYAMYQSVLYFDHTVPENLLWKNCPDNKVGDFDYLIAAIDWDLNLDPDFALNHLMRPTPSMPMEDMVSAGYKDEHICYKCPSVGAKRLTVFPNRNVTLKNDFAYGLICIQGYGRINGMQLASPNMIRFGELTNDEYFVSIEASQHGVYYENLSESEPLVILYHFAKI